MSDGDDAIGQSAPELGEDLRELLERKVRSPGESVRA